MTDLEIAVQDAAGVRIALEGGASRVELCAALETGGLTPSIGCVHSALRAAGNRKGFVHVLVRSRGGGYVYTPDEQATMCEDIRALRGTGVDGVVVGTLTPTGHVDRDTLGRLMEAAGDLTVTFHRALDAATDPVAEIKGLAEAGVSRVLTSGAARRSIDGLGMLSAMARTAPAGLQVMAGGGVRVADIPALAATGVDAIHLSARTTRTDPFSAGPGGGVQELDVTDLSLVTRARAALDAVQRNKGSIP